MILFILVFMLAGVLFSYFVSSLLTAGESIGLRFLVFILTFVYSGSFWYKFVFIRGNHTALPSFFDNITSCSAPLLASGLLIFGIAKLIFLFPSLKYNFRLQHFAGFLAMSICIAILVYGIYNAAHPVVRKYEIESEKLDSELTAVVISDLHLGASGMTHEKLEKIVDNVNSQSADLVLIPGDMLDMSDEPLYDAKIMEILSRLKGKYGVYASLGNHDIYGGVTKNLIEKMDEIGIKILVDEVIDIENGLRVIGRDDASWSHGKTNRKPVSEFVDEGRINIVMDHSPKFFDEAVAAFADLQVSGHTHNGQYFPINFIIKFFYEKPWGILKKNKSIVFTSCGVGTWGAPVRSGSVSEIAVLKLVPIKK